MNLDLDFGGQTSFTSPVATFASPVANQSGKSAFVDASLHAADGKGAGGGLAVGLASAQAAGVKIVLLTRPEFDGERCGGKKGKNGKVCILKGCTVAAHASPGNKLVAELFTREDGADIAEVVCIACSPTKEDEEPDAVFVSPVLEPQQLGQDIHAYLHKTRPAESWRYFFSGIEKNPNASDEQLSAFDQRLEHSSPATFTPFAKRRRTKPASPIDGNDLKQLYSGISGQLPTERPKECISIMIKDWAQMASNVENLSGAFQSVINNLERTKEYMEENLGETNDAIVKVRDDLGRRTDAVGLKSAFELLDELASKEDGQDGDEIKADILEDVFNELRRELQPIVEFAAHWSSSKDQVGDHLKTAVQDLQSRLAAVETQLANLRLSRGAVAPPTAGLSNAGSGSRPPASLSLGFAGSATGGTSAGAPAATLPPDAIGALQEEVKFVKDCIVEIRDELGADAVTIGDQVFQSRSALTSLFTKESVPPQAFCCFPDALGLMGVSHRRGLEGDGEALDYQVKLRKSGFATVEEAKVANTFLLAIPAHFGSAPKTGASARDSRTLPGVPTHNDWDSGNGYVGLAYDLAADVEAGAKDISELMPYLVSPDVRALATWMQQAAKRFVTSLITWINQTMISIQQRSLASKGEAWNLTAHCVRTVFDLLTKARASGGKYTRENRLERMVWGMMQAHVVQEEMLKLGFDAHPAVSHTLHVHLQNNCVMRSVFDKLSARVNDMEKKLRTQATTIDTLKSKVG